MDHNIKIAILTIATNNYKDFLNPLIESIQKNFLPSNQKDIFVFADEDTLSYKYSNIIFNKIQHEQWPFITLKRFNYFSKVLEKLINYDMVIYFDVDLEVIKNISKFPICDLFGVMHPGIYAYGHMWDIETNPKSTAYISPENKGIYHQGCFWGGSSIEICKMIDKLNNNIEIDLSNNIIAKWHDESHLNHYLFNNKNKVFTISSSFCYPENWNLQIPKIIIHKDKNMKEYPRFEGSKHLFF
jgi:hypothetical protein